jgi:hypothetical protein
MGPHAEAASGPYKAATSPAPFSPQTLSVACSRAAAVAGTLAGRSLRSPPSPPFRWREAPLENDREVRSVAVSFVDVLALCFDRARSSESAAASRPPHHARSSGSAAMSRLPCRAARRCRRPCAYIGALVECAVTPTLPLCHSRVKPSPLLRSARAHRSPTARRRSPARSPPLPACVRLRPSNLNPMAQIEYDPGSS